MKEKAEMRKGEEELTSLKKEGREGNKKTIGTEEMGRCEGNKKGKKERVDEIYWPAHVGPLNEDAKA